jgi:hypothetical protein
MWLTRIEPYLSDRDMRTFECDGCGHSEMIAVKYSNAALSRSAWLKNLRDTRLSPTHRHLETVVVLTNKVPTTPVRGAGRPQAVFAMERLLDRVVRELQLDRAEVRRRNFIKPEQMPYEVGLLFRDGKPLVYDSGDYPKGQETALELAGYESFRERQRVALDGKRSLRNAGGQAWDSVRYRSRASSHAGRMGAYPPNRSVGREIFRTGRTFVGPGRTARERWRIG